MRFRSTTKGYATSSSVEPKPRNRFYGIVMFLIFLEKNMFGNQVEAKKRERGGTGVVPAKWTQMIKSVMA